MLVRVVAFVVMCSVAAAPSPARVQDAQPAAAVEPPDLIADPRPQSMALMNAQVFDGERFVRRDLYVSGGVFVDAPPPTLERQIDLAGAFIIPGLGESHTHRVSYAGMDATTARAMFVTRGVLYVANVNCPANAREQASCCTNRPDSPDVIFANGGFTASGGHPVKLYEVLHTRMLRQDPETFMATNDGNTFYRIDTPADLGAKWPGFIATKPDLVKTYVLYSEQFAQRRDDEAVFGAKGLDPANLKLIVEKARGAGLRVATHVETAQDFRNAVGAGVDWLVHMPGYMASSKMPPEAWALTKADADDAARRGVMVTLTCGLNKPATFGGASRSHEAVEATRRVQAANVRVLKEAGVKLLFGSDDWAGPAGECYALHALGTFTPTEILQMWSVVTPRAIFPGRKVGSLDPGMEATLVVLDADPLADPGNYGRVRLVCKQGAVIAERAVVGAGAGGDR